MRGVSKREKEMSDTDNSVLIVGVGGVGVEEGMGGINDDGEKIK